MMQHRHSWEHPTLVYWAGSRGPACAAERRPGSLYLAPLGGRSLVGGRPGWWAQQLAAWHSIRGIGSLAGPLQGLGVDRQAHDRQAVVHVHRLASHCGREIGGKRSR